MKTYRILIAGMVIVLFVVISSGCGSSSNTQPSPSSSAIVMTAAPTVSAPPTASSAPTTSIAATASASSTTTDKNAVAMTGIAFLPAVLTINKGETVTWTNQDSVKHDVIGSTFNSSLFGKGETFSFTFNETGTFTYKCSVHANMYGQIIVK